MISINLSKDADYHSQRNNSFIPLESCQSTSMIMGLKASGIDFDYPSNMQPEDYLTSILESKEIYELAIDKYPWAIKQGIPLNTVHGLLEYATNKLVGKKVDTFTTNAKIETLLLNLLNGKASLVSGRFTSYGHVVCLVGFETEQNDITDVKVESDIDLWKVKNFIIDDPYGNPLKEYSSFNGNNVKLTYKQFNWYTREYDKNSKWAHILK